MRLLIVLLMLPLLSACTVQTDDGITCDGQIPHVATQDGRPLTTHTASCRYN